jgi:hypothetical protein
VLASGTVLEHDEDWVELSIRHALLQEEALISNDRNANRGGS